MTQTAFAIQPLDLTTQAFFAVLAATAVCVIGNGMLTALVIAG